MNNNLIKIEEKYKSAKIINDDLDEKNKILVEEKNNQNFEIIKLNKQIKEIKEKHEKKNFQIL